MLKVIKECGYTGEIGLLRDYLSSHGKKNMSKMQQKIKEIPKEDCISLIKLQNSNNRKIRDKALTILNGNYLSFTKLRLKLVRPKTTLAKWVKKYNHGGITELIMVQSARPNSSKTIEIALKRKRIIEIVHQSPMDFNINRSSWNQQSIVDVYLKLYNTKISKSSVSEYLKKEGYTIRKVKRVLTSHDPYYREKIVKILTILQSLKAEEKFFFIDEMGPVRVKKYGGRMYTKKGEMHTFPQNQTSKGSIILSAAISASTNQISWVYSDSKDTYSMIELCEVLYNQYYNNKHIYITWDAASWHSSNMLIDWLDNFNRNRNQQNSGPIIEFVPLPSSCQSLNVIETIFSGMKRAVIHNSDYQSKDEMKIAISRHFNERNEYFKLNPKRVGKKIWEIDFFQDFTNIKSGDYREW